MPLAGFSLGTFTCAAPLSTITAGHNRATALYSRIVTDPRSNRIPLAILFAVLWTAGLLWRAPSLDLQSVVTAVVTGAIVGGLMYWLFDKFRARP